MAHGGRITGDEMLQIAVLVVPLLFLIAIGLTRVMRRGHPDRAGARRDDRPRR
jgi:hypothetical protein